MKDFIQGYNSNDKILDFIFNKKKYIYFKKINILNSKRIIFLEKSIIIFQSEVDYRLIIFFSNFFIIFQRNLRKYSKSVQGEDARID